MARWIVGGCVRWKEPDWFQKGMRKKEFFKKGEREVSAQVRSISGDLVKLKVLRCDVISDQSAKGVHVLKAGKSSHGSVPRCKNAARSASPGRGRRGERAGAGRNEEQIPEIKQAAI